jgi:hypothetical protein
MAVRRTALGSFCHNPLITDPISAVAGFGARRLGGPEMPRKVLRAAFAMFVARQAAMCYRGAA